MLYGYLEKSLEYNDLFNVSFILNNFYNKLQKVYPNLFKQIMTYAIKRNYSIICILVQFAYQHNINLNWIQIEYPEYWYQIENCLKKIV